MKKLVEEEGGFGKRVKEWAGVQARGGKKPIKRDDIKIEGTPNTGF